MAKEKDDKEKDVLTTQNDAPKEADAPEAPEVKAAPEKKAEAKVETKVEATVETPTKKEATLTIVGRAIMFLAFKVLEPNEFKEFKTRYPEL